MSGDALTVEGLGVAFPGVRALHDIDLTVGSGHVHALLGENGAGKSTLIKVVTGAQKPHAGTVRVDGRELRPYTPRAAQRLGVRVVHQERQIAPDLSVAQNVLLDDVARGPVGFVTTRGIVRRAQHEIDALGLDLDARMLAGDLTAAQQQLVELVRAVHRRAVLVVMDEPTASLRRAEVEVLFRVIGSLRQSGQAVLYISHHLHEVFEVADTATVLRNGEKVGDFSVAETTTDELVSAMFDREVSHVRLPRSGRQAGAAAVSGRGISRPPVLLPVDIDVLEGEILVLCGAAGSGTSEVAEVLAGAARSATGTLAYGNRKIIGRSRTAAAGVGFVPADRKAAGLLLERPIVENLLLSRRGWRTATYWPYSAVRLAREALTRGRVRAADPRRAVSTLSGGNQQRVIFARWLLAGSDVLVLDQPTAGVDIAAKFEIYQQLLDLAAEGMAVVMVSSDYEEISCLADRVLVMRDGMIVAELDGTDANPERLYQLEMAGEPSPAERSA